MITDEEAKKAAEILKDNCKNHNNCNGCPFSRGRTDELNCKLSYPDEWSL